jgi:hypothetical protein
MLWILKYMHCPTLIQARLICYESYYLSYFYVTYAGIYWYHLCQKMEGEHTSEILLFLY